MTPQMKTIPRAERLIAALDVAGVEEAKALVQRLGDSVSFYKVGLELFMAEGFFAFIDWLARTGKKVFVDLKFFDIPETVRAAVRGLGNRGVIFTAPLARAAASSIAWLPCTVAKVTPRLPSARTAALTHSGLLEDFRLIHTPFPPPAS